MQKGEKCGVEKVGGGHRDWSSQVQDQVTSLETNMQRLEASRRVMREEMADLTRGMYLLVELNQ